MCKCEKEKVFVYGTGEFTKKHTKEIENEYEIIAFLDSFKEGMYDKWHIYKFTQTILEQYEYRFIIIMVESGHNFFQIYKSLRELLDKEKLSQIIIWGITKYGDKKESFTDFSILSNEKFKITINEVTLCVSTEDELINTIDTLINHCYLYHINNMKKDIVIDIGMNVGDSTLYFLKNSKVEKVYGYEPFKKTFLDAQENLKDYLADPRLEIQQYGLSSKNEHRILKAQQGMSCGQSTNEESNNIAFKNYENWGLLVGEVEEESIVVRDAAEEISKIMKKHPENNIILKVDCEGEEYGIMQTLFEHGILQSITFIMMEWHYQGNQIILDLLKKAGLSYYCYNKTSYMGLVYAWNK